MRRKGLGRNLVFMKTYIEKAISEFKEKFVIQPSGDLICETTAKEQIESFLRQKLEGLQKEIEYEYAGLVTDEKLEKVIQLRIKEKLEEIEKKIEKIEIPENIEIANGEMFKFAWTHALSEVKEMLKAKE